MKVGLCTIAFGNLPLNDVIDLAEKHHLDGVEIWGKDHLPLDASNETIDKVRKLCEDKGLEINAYGSYIRVVDNPDFEKEMERGLDIANRLSANILRIWSGGKELDKSRWDEVADKILPWTEPAKEKNIVIAFECHDNCVLESAEALRYVVEKVNSRYLRTYYQPFVKPDKEDPYTQAKILAPYVVCVHAQNRPKEPNANTWRSEFIETGTVDYTKVKNILVSNGFDGYFEIEFVSDSNPIEGLKRDAEFLRSLIGQEQ